MVSYEVVFGMCYASYISAMIISRPIASSSERRPGSVKSLCTLELGAIMAGAIFPTFV